MEFNAILSPLGAFGPMIGGVLLLLLVVKLLSMPFKLVWNGLCGALLLWFINLVGLLAGFTMKITVIKALIAGVYFGYAYYGGVTGHLILAGTVVFGFGMTWYVLRTKTWKRLSLDTRLEGTVEGIGDSVKAGDCGETLGRLAPMGNVKLGDMVVEAESRSGYIDAHRPVEVVKVLRNKVIVQLKTV